VENSEGVLEIQRLSSVGLLLYICDILGQATCERCPVFPYVKEIDTDFVHC